MEVEVGPEIRVELPEGIGKLGKEKREELKEALEFAMFMKILSIKSDLTREEAMEISKKIKERIWEKIKKRVEWNER